MKILPIYSSLLAILYLLVLSCISLLYMRAGVVTMYKTKLSNSVPSLVMFLFIKCLSILRTYSVARATLTHVLSEESEADTCLVNPAVEFSHLVFLLFLCSTAPIYYFFPTSTDYIYWVIAALYIAYPSYFPSHYINLLSRILNSLSLRPCSTWLQIYMLGHENADNFPRLIGAPDALEQEKKNSIFSRNKKIVKMIKFAVGMMGTVLFQNYFRLNSFEQVLAFIYIAIAWLANIMMLSVSDDFGVFNFILGNVMVGSMVGEFRLGAHTWLAYAASLLLYRLRLELESASLIEGRLDSRGVIVCLLLFIILLFGLFI